MRRTLFSAVAVAMAVFFWACSQPTTTASVASSDRAGSQALSAGQVTTTIRGQVLDGLGNPVPGVSVEYSDGSNPAVTTTPAARTLQTTGTDSHGIFELQYLSQTVGTTGTLGGTVYVSLKRDGYTGRRIPIILPLVTALSGQTIKILNGQAISSTANTTGTSDISINVGQTVQVDLTNSGTTSTSAGTKTYITNTIGGFHVASDLGTATMFQLAAEVTGTVKLKNADTDPNGTAFLAPVNSIIAFNFPDGTYSPYVITAMVDATGKFVFGAAGKDASGKPNGLPIFGANTDNVNPTDPTGAATAGTVTPWGSSDTATAAAQKFNFSVQVASTQVDAAGSAFYLVNKASASNSTVLANLSFLTTSALTPQSIGTLYAIADNRARLIAWSPQTIFDGATVPMAQLTGTTPTPITLTFSKAMDPLLTPVTGISFTADSINYWSADSTITWNAANTVATLAPKLTFPKGKLLTLNVNNWIAADGAAVAGKDQATFKVQDGLILVGASWLDASRVASPVALNATPAVTFNLAPAAFDATATGLYDVTASNAKVAATFALNATTKQLVATPLATLKPGNKYEIRFSVTSGVVGDPAATYSGTVPTGWGTANSNLMQFTTDNTNQLVLTGSNLWKFDTGNSASGTGGVTGTASTTDNFDPTKAITATFNKKIATTPLPSVVLTKTSDSSTVLSTLAWDTTGTIATLTPSLALAGDTQYTLTYTVYPDASTLTGGLLPEAVGLNSTITFKTTKAASIKLINTSTVTPGQVVQPALAVTTPIVLTFDTPVVLTKAPTFTLTPSAAFTVGWNPTNTVATLTPVTNWANGTTYSLTAVVNADALGINTTGPAGNTVTFKTVDALAVSSVRMGSATAFAATGIPVSGTPMVITFNQPVKTGAGQFVMTFFQDKANNTFWYADNQVNIPTTVTWDATNTVATVTPTSPLQLATIYGLGFQVFAAVGPGTLDNGKGNGGTASASFQANDSTVTKFTTVAASIPRLVSTNLQVNNIPAAAFPYLGTAGANNITLTFDQAIPSGTAVAATSFVYGKTYAIATVGTTDYTLLGAANNTVGTVFTMSGGLGAGTGTAFPIMGLSAVLSSSAVNPTLVASFDATGTILTLSTPTGVNLTPNTAYTLTYNVTTSNIGVTGNKTLTFTTALPVYASIPTLSLDTTGGKLTYNQGDTQYSLQVTGLDPLATQLVFEAAAGTSTTWNTINTGSGYVSVATGLTYIGGTGTTAKYLYSFTPSTPATVTLVSGSNVRLRVRQNFGTTAANDSPNSTVLSVTDTTTPIAANVGATGSAFLNSGSATSTFVTLKFNMTAGPANEALALPALSAISLYSGTWPGTPVSASLATVSNAYLSQTTTANDTLNVVLNLAKYVRLGTAPATVGVVDGAFIIGNVYTITALGVGTNWTTLGAGATPAVGTSFTAAATTGGGGSGTANTTSFVATSLVNGSTYTISTVGTTDFTLIGALTNALGTTFVKSGPAGLGNGTATPTPVYGLNIGSLVSGTASTAGNAFADAAGNLLDNGVAASKTTKGQINFTISSTGTLTPVATN